MSPVLEILCDPEPVDTPIKWILAAGLCGWVIDPTDNHVSNTLMYLEAELVLEECCAYASESDLGSEDLEDIVGKYVFPGECFHDDIRSPLAGPDPQEFMTSRVDLKNELKSELKSINTINYCLAALHAMGSLYKAKDKTVYLPPSWNLIRKLAEEKRVGRKVTPTRPMFQSHYSATRLREVWKKYTPSLSMLYAANFVQITRKRTLLDMIISTELNTRALVSVLPEWLKRSAHFHHNYLKPLGNTGQSRVGDWLAQNVDFSGLREKQVEPSIMNAVKKNFNK